MGTVRGFQLPTEGADEHRRQAEVHRAGGFFSSGVRDVDGWMDHGKQVGQEAEHTGGRWVRFRLAGKPVKPGGTDNGGARSLAVLRPENTGHGGQDESTGEESLCGWWLCTMV